MTRRREFKTLVRERMQKTGERYTAARTQLLHTRPDTLPATETFPGVFRGYDRFGGTQGDTAALCNVLRHAGITSPLTGAPYSEAMINGLCGGPGFLYAVFEYKGHAPMLTIAMRSRSMNDLFIADGLPRLGVNVITHETTSPGAARKALDAALASGKATLCVTDMASLPWYGLPAEFCGGMPHVVAVAGRDNDDVWIDDRSTRPMRLSLADLANARARCKTAKHRLITIDGPASPHDQKRAMREAIVTTARRYTEPPVPKSFWSNCGFAGLDKWQRLLTDARDKKGWPAVFGEGARAYAGLQRAYEWISGPSGPHGGRGVYADFLNEAARSLEDTALERAAAEYRTADALWTAIATRIATCGDGAIRQACEIADRRFALVDTGEAGVSATSRALWQQRDTLAPECGLSKGAAREIYADIAGLVAKIAAAERQAVAHMGP